MTIRVRAPASSANLGPGFDVLALALDLWAEARFEDRPGSGISLHTATSPPDAATNLVARAYVAACDAASVPDADRGALITTDDAIPLGRGLGSSAAAIALGLTAARHRFSLPLTTADLIDLGARIEGHADNLAAAMLGQLAVCAADNPPLSVTVDPGIHAVVFIPTIQLDTESARRVLPEWYTRADAVYTSGHCTQLALALHRGHSALLRVAMQDRLHQPARAVLMPHIEPLIAAALDAGALGAALSGAGPSVLAICDPAGRASVGDAVAARARELGLDGSVRRLEVAATGAHVEEAA